MLDFTKLLFNNLYKFLFVAGMVVSLTAIIAPEYLEFRLESKSVEVKKSIAKMEIENTRLERDMKIADAEFEILKKRIGNNTANNNLLEGELKNSLDQSIQRSDKIFDLQLKSKEISIYIDFLKYVDKKINYINSIKIYTLAFGILILIIGISGWYYKVQRLLDKKLGNESLKTGA